MRSLLAICILLCAAPALAAQNVVSWTDNSDNETAFNIERKAEACAGTGAFTPLASVGANVTTYTDTTVIQGHTYCYRVNAGNTAGVSAWSNTAGRTVPFTIPAAPSGVGVGP